VASTATTGGIANPFLSVFEDGGVIALSLLAFVAPFIAAVLCVVVVVIMVWVARRATAFVRSRSRS
jgi:ABC-type sulfate transport system permease component